MSITTNSRGTVQIVVLASLTILLFLSMFTILTSPILYIRYRQNYEVKTLSRELSPGMPAHDEHFLK